MKMEKIFTTLSSTLIVRAENGRLLFESLFVPNGSNIIFTSSLPFPKKYGKTDYIWRLCDFYDTDRGVAFVFEAFSARYTVYIEADPDLPGPFEVCGRFENLSRVDIALTFGDIFSIRHKLRKGTA